MGKTIICGLIIRTYKDYPRLRGKDLQLLPLSMIQTGSPPLARERHIVLFIPPTSIGITPADAGKTNIVAFIFHQLQDHPRLRGKDEYLSPALPAVLGAPPLTRERPFLTIPNNSCIFGIERAWLLSGTGSPCEQSLSEPCSFLYVSNNDSGSPPLTRERLPRPYYHHIFYGITPAHAGKTIVDILREHVSMDHPR